MQSYLIQRAKFETCDRKGIDGLLSFDYMGSSEFEWGALPKSLKRIRDNSKEYCRFVFEFEDYEEKTLVVLCKKDDSENVVKILHQLLNNEIMLKEYCDLNKYLNGKAGSDFWWDIENDFFFWKENYDFTNEFTKLLFNQN